ncbi:MAG: hypothetical protein AB7U98_08765 [Candidatus Nitrosocosmicus sp.]|jgi:uncharacterized membrane-anchored protein|uniref:hypothetical protein n=1 Tax=Candidatus Nitrosocosmicus sp. FF01 TaxID=3397670 RepID=UPI0039EC7E3A
MSQKHKKTINLFSLAILPLLLISGSVVAFGQTNISNTTQTSNQTGASSDSNNDIIQSIDSGIASINNGDNDGAKKSFYQAELALEDKPDLSSVEKQIEASLKALKDGDTNAAITHAEEAKKSLI